MTARALLLLTALWTLAGLSFASGGDDAGGFTPVTGPCGFAFPRDHGPHPGHKTEWWYYTGSLRGPSGNRYGFQFTLFRSQVLPSAIEHTWPEPRSGWRSNQLLMGHAALTDVAANRHLQGEALSRAAMNLAGWSDAQGWPSFFLRDWALAIGPQAHELTARGPEFAYRLRLGPAKGPVAHGDGGYSRKGERPESASCYYSFPRLSVSGEVEILGKTVPVTGTAWMDHEYSSAPLEPGILGWDWFSLRLSDGSDLMVFFLRREDGFSTASGGTLIAADGAARPMALPELSLAATGTWTSPRSGARYPSGWRLAAPGLELVVEPEVSDQEMNTSGTTGVNYWEGLVRARGTRDGKEVTGEGYVELTGYDKPFTARY